MKKTILASLIILMALLTACSRQVGWVGLNYLNTFDVSYNLFDGRKVERIQLDAGETFNLTYDLEVDDGALRFELLDPDREVVWETSFLEDHEDEFRFRAEKSGRYTLRINGDQTKGGFELRWERSE
jgi:major membrane immunogen (membrane-anchored lipoprotein)